MVASYFPSLIPILIIAVTCLIALLSIAIHRNHLLVFMLCIAGWSSSLLSIALVPVQPPAGFLFKPDRLGITYIMLIEAACMVTAVFSYHYLNLRAQKKEEYYLLLLTASLGATVLVTSSHFVPFFTGLELLTVSLYILIAYFRTSGTAVEAGIKYLVLAAVSSSFLLFGMALIYSDTGAMNFDKIAISLRQFPAFPLLSTAGLILVLAGIGFKLGWVPFHQWAPDIYQGAPAPVSAFIATVSKGAVFAVFIRLYAMLKTEQSHALFLVFSFLAISSMLIGNVLALKQANIKRLLAYSSIAHLGYLLAAFLTGKDTGIQASTFYLVVYFIAVFGAFGVIILLSGKDADLENISDYQGLYYKHPFIAFTLSVMLLSLAGIPLTGGFLGKYFILAAGIHANLWILMIVLVISSIIGLYYYLRIITLMFSKTADEISPEFTLSFSPGVGITLSVLFILLIWFGVYPSPILQIINTIK